MPRGLIVLIVLLVVLIVGAFVLSGRIHEQPTKTIEVPVDANAGK